MKWTHQTKEMIQYGVAMVCIVFGLVLVAIGGLAIEPIGEVSASFLTCLGVLLTFAGSIFGISAHYNSELVNFKSEIRSKLDEEEVTLKSNKENSEEQDTFCYIQNSIILKFKASYYYYYIKIEIY